MPGAGCQTAASMQGLLAEPAAHRRTAPAAPSPASSQASAATSKRSWSGGCPPKAAGQQVGGRLLGGSHGGGRPAPGRRGAGTRGRAIVPRRRRRGKGGPVSLDAGGGAAVG